MVPPSSFDYAGDIDAAQAWEQLQNDPKAQLIDVRTMAEWNFVGLPDLSGLGRRTHCVEWQSFPTGAQNPGFVTEAAQALTAAGFEKAFNVAGGFEGDVDGQGHRGNRNGWKASGLPWRQG